MKLLFQYKSNWAKLGNTITQVSQLNSNNMKTFITIWTRFQLEFMTKKMQWQNRNIRRLKKKHKKKKTNTPYLATQPCVCKHHPSGTEDRRSPAENFFTKS